MARSRRLFPAATLALVGCTQLRTYDPTDAAAETAPDVPAPSCDGGARPVGAACVGETALPRPLAPGSLATVTQRRPTFRWELPPQSFDGAQLELCADRACARPLETVLAQPGQSSARPTRDLPARSVVFWRVRGRLGDAADSRTGPVWLLRVPAQSASSGVDTSYGIHSDFDGDGFADWVVSAPQLEGVGLVYVLYGRASALSGTADVVLRGAEPGANFGATVAPAGDLNGDGYGDLLVGASRAGNNAGYVALYYGGPLGIDANRRRDMPGATPGDLNGASIAGFGDVDGDGYGDLGLGAPGVNGGAGGWAFGLGGPEGPTQRTSRSLFGNGAYSTALRGAGDVNGDGFADVLVSSPGEAGGRGRVYLYLGQRTGISNDASWTFDGPELGDRLGDALAGAFDANGDGYADVAFGAPAHAAGLGQVLVFAGSAAGLDSVPSRSYLGGGGAGGRYGAALASPGDVDGDGFAELLTGSPGRNAAAGSAYLYLGGAAGLSSQSQRTFNGGGPGARLGASVAGGDLTGDGFADVVLGASPSLSADGRAYVFLGGAQGTAASPAVDLGLNGGFGAAVAARLGP